MNESVQGYKELNKEELGSLWGKHKIIIEAFLDKNGYDRERIKINERTMLSIISKVDQRHDYFRYFHQIDMSELKEIALNAFWLIKLKPLTAIEDNSTPVDYKNNDGGDNREIGYDSLNERLAIYYILRGLRAFIRKKREKGIAKDAEMVLDSLPGQYIDELLYTFTFRDMSKEAMILLVESMVTFMGINPYREESGE